MNNCSLAAQKVSCDGVQSRKFCADFFSAFSAFEPQLDLNPDLNFSGPSLLPLWIVDVSQWTNCKLSISGKVRISTIIFTFPASSEKPIHSRVMVDPRFSGKWDAQGIACLLMAGHIWPHGKDLLLSCEFKSFKWIKRKEGMRKVIIKKLWLYLSHWELLVVLNSHSLHQTVWRVQ